MAYVASPKDTVYLYTWLNTLLASRAEADRELTFCERSLLRAECLAKCAEQNAEASGKVMATLTEGYPDNDIRFALREMSEAVKSCSLKPSEYKIHYNDNYIEIGQ